MIFCLVLSLWLTNLKFVLYFSVYFVTVLGFTPSATTTTTIVWRSTRGRQWGIVQYADSLVHEWLSHRLLPGTQTCQERPHYHKSHLHWVTTNTRHICRQIMQPQPIYIYRTLKLINLYIRIVYVGGGVDIEPWQQKWWLCWAYLQWYRYWFQFTVMHPKCITSPRRAIL